MTRKGIRERRERFGLSQHTIAWRAKCSQSSVSLVESGESSCHMDAIRRVLDEDYLSRRKVRAAEQRIAAQRAVFASRDSRALQDAMVDRVWQLLQEGADGTIGADALLEFLPAEVAEGILREFFGNYILDSIGQRAYIGGVARASGFLRGRS